MSKLNDNMSWSEYYQPCLPCQIGSILEHHFPLASDLTVHMSSVYLSMLLGEQIFWLSCEIMRWTDLNCDGSNMP